MAGAGALLGLVAALGGAGCAKKVVAAPPEPPALVIPVVPPRLVGPVVVQDEPPQPVAEAPAESAPPPAPRPARKPTASQQADATRQENGGTPVEAPKTEPAAGEQASAAPPAEPRLLRTPETANDSEAVRRVRETLARADQNLKKVNYSTLTQNGRAQADTVRRFITQADEALKARSITFARFLADKAETLSTSLLNR